MAEDIAVFDENSKDRTGLKQKCQVISGLIKKICKVFSGRVIFWCKVQAIYLYI